MSELRTIEAADIDAWVRQLGTGFHFEVAEGLAAYMLPTLHLDRTWASFDGERLVGTLRSFPTALTVPGPSEVRASALTSVTVAPTHRRQGRLTAMIEADLRGAVDRDEAVGILIASEYPIYGRYGYGAAVESAKYAVRSTDVVFREPTSGSVELVDRATLRREAPAIYDRYRAGQPGAIEREDRWWDRRLRQVEVPGDEPPKGQVALYRSSSGDLEGYVSYEATQEWDDMRPQGVLKLHELVANSTAAYQGLWSYCCGVDLLTSVEAPLRPVDEVLPYLLNDGRAVKLTARFDFVWVRILDAPQSLAARTYAAPGRMVLEVLDPLGFARGCFELDGSPDGATCKPTTASPELTVSIDALGSAYLGGVSLRTLQLAAKVHEHRGGAVARADAMFGTSRAPWCSTWF